MKYIKLLLFSGLILPSCFLAMQQKLLAMKTVLLIDNAQEEDSIVQIQKPEPGYVWERLCDIQAKEEKKFDVTKFWFFPEASSFIFLNLRILSSNAIRNALDIQIYNGRLQCTLSKNSSDSTKKEFQESDMQTLQNASLLRIKLLLHGEELSKSTFNIAFLSE